MIKEKGPLQNLFVKVSEDLDFVTTIKPVNSRPTSCNALSLCDFYAGTIAYKEQARLRCVFASFIRSPWIYGTLQFHFCKRCVSFIDFVHSRYADHYLS